MEHAPKSDPPFFQQTVTGWGRFLRSQALIWQPEEISALQSWVTEHPDPLTPIGLRRSYADAALPQKGIGVDLCKLNKIKYFDTICGEITVEAGLSVGDLLLSIVPHGFFIPVTPGTRYVTLGGAIAHDVHGKNHHVSGSISRYVTGLKLLTATGEIVVLKPNDPIFAATVAGLGLTGIITEVTLKLLRIETSFVVQKKVKADHLGALMAAFEEDHGDWPYSVAWVDCLAKGTALGRGHLICGRHAMREELPQKWQKNPLPIHTEPRISVPFEAPSFLLHSRNIQLFNKAFYYRQWRHIQESIVHYDPFFYPLDAIGNWNKLYGKHGFVQFQCVIPFQNAEEVLRTLIELGAKSGRPSFLSVLKKMGPNDLGLLSFGSPGWTLTMDFPIDDQVSRLMKNLENVVQQAHGRLYLSKDAFLAPEIFRKMYVGWQEWQTIKSAIDPNNRFNSVLGRRLNLIP